MLLLANVKSKIGVRNVSGQGGHDEPKKGLTFLALGRDLLGLEGVVIIAAIRAGSILLGCTGENGGAGEQGKDSQDGDEENLHSDGFE